MRLFVFAFLAILTLSVNAQSENGFVLELKASKQYQNMLGTNVYNDAHSSWDGIQIYTGLRCNKIWSFGLKFQHFKARSIDSTLIYHATTNLRNYGVEMGRHFYFYNRISVAPFINFGTIKGKNQGKFDGTQIGIGGNLHFYFWRGLYLCAGTEYNYQWLDIKAPKDIVKLYNQASVLQASFGLGARF